MKEIQLCTNETVLELLAAYKDRLKKAEKLVVISVITMLLQTIIIVGGVLYFLNAYTIEVTDEVTEVTQTVEGDNTSINNVNGDSNTITNTNTMGGAE